MGQLSIQERVSVSKWEESCHFLNDAPLPHSKKYRLPIPYPLNVPLKQCCLLDLHRLTMGEIRNPRP